MNFGKPLFVLSFLLVSILTKAQIAQPSGKVNVNLNANGIVEATKPAPPGYKGSHYFDEDWRTGRIELFDGKVAEGLLLRYELKEQQLDLIFIGSNEPRMISGNIVKGFQWIDPDTKKTHYFVNPKLYKIADGQESESINGFLEVLVEDEKIELYVQHKVSLKRSYYVAALDAGNKDNEWIQERVYWVAIENKLFELPLNKKKAIEFFEARGIDAESCINSRIKNDQLAKDMVDCLNNGQ